MGNPAACAAGGEGGAVPAGDFLGEQDPQDLGRVPALGLRGGERPRGRARRMCGSRSRRSSASTSAAAAPVGRRTGGAGVLRWSSGHGALAVAGRRRAGRGPGRLVPWASCRASQALAHRRAGSAARALVVEDRRQVVLGEPAVDRGVAQRPVDVGWSRCSLARVTARPS